MIYIMKYFSQSLNRDPSSPAGESMKLGLGDFIFYSLLVSKAALAGFAPFAACFLVVVLGLVATLIILAIVEIPLPALPFSMFAGVTVYFWTQYLVAPWIAELGYSGVLV